MYIYFNLQKKFLSSFGGKSASTALSDLLPAVFSNQVAVEYCYAGLNKKKSSCAVEIDSANNR